MENQSQAEKNYEASDVGNNEGPFLTVDDRITTIEATNFLYNFLPTKKRLHEPDYKRLSEKIIDSPMLVVNSDAKTTPNYSKQNNIKAWIENATESIKEITTGWQAGCWRLSSRKELNASVGNFQIFRN